MFFYLTTIHFTHTRQGNQIFMIIFHKMDIYLVSIGCFSAVEFVVITAETLHISMNGKDMLNKKGKSVKINLNPYPAE